MLFYALILFFLSNAKGALLPEQRIIGGSEIEITDAPYNAAILVDEKSNGSYVLKCGGAIISNNTVLTAAQCIHIYPVGRMLIRVGSKYNNVGGKTIEVSGYKQHEKFNPSNFDNDIAIIYLSEHIMTSDSVSSISLAEKEDLVSEGSIGFFTGWGYTTLGGSTSTVLRMMTVPVVNQEICRSLYSGINPVTSNMFCAGLLGIGGVDACVGDNGGPMLISQRLYGISSWGYSCASPNYPGVYTKVSAFRTWIDQNNG